jgi:hypothetical protein
VRNNEQRVDCSLAWRLVGRAGIGPKRQYARRGQPKPPAADPRGALEDVEKVLSGSSRYWYSTDGAGAVDGVDPRYA